MLAARRLQNGCPSCTAQILRLYVQSIAGIAPPPAAAARRSGEEMGSRTRFRVRRHDARLLSTSSKRSTEGTADKTLRNSRPDRSADDVTQFGAEKVARKPHPDEALDDVAQPREEELPEELAKRNRAQELADGGHLGEVDHQDQMEELPETQDPETIVRQAKRMFRDTLPAGYLSDEEYNLYERLYGPPLRQTAPEDVGFGSLGEAAEDEEAKQAAKNLLFREDPHGNLEEVEYRAVKRAAAVEITGVDGETGVVEEEEETLEARPPNDTQLGYIEANASNQREYNALLRLQQDFETTRIRAAQEAADLEREYAVEETEEQDEVDEEEEDIEEDEEDEDEEADAEPDGRFAWYPSHEGPRLHEYTMEGKFNTSPKTLFLPKHNFIDHITELLKRTDIKHVRAAAEQNFGGPGLPHSPATPKFGKNLEQKGLGIGVNDHKVSEIEADAFIATALPGIYASVMSALVEARKRLGPEWLRGLLNRKDGDDVGPRVLDAGAGGAGLAAWQEVLQAEWDTLREKDADLAAAPPGKKTVVVGSGQLRYRISRFLENTTFLPRLPNYAQVDNSDKQLDAPETPQKRKVYDIIIATHLLVPLEKEWRRKEVLDNLWSMLSPEGGVLIVLEKGHPRGFEAVADVRQRLLDEFILAPTPQARQYATEPETEPRVREPGMIVAPCTNHSKCPMYLTRGKSPGRKDFCHFSQRFIRPPFLQRVLGSTHRNHEDINFSFIAVRRGMPAPNAIGAEPAPDAADMFATPPEAAFDSDILSPKSVLQGEAATKAALAGYESVPTSSDQRPHPLSLPRNILPPLKRKGHVTLDLCTPSGSIERWTVPKSFSKQAYHDARKSRWGDLWALGAKTRVRRSVRLGRGVKEGETVPDDGGVRAARAAALNGMVGAKGRKRGKARPKVVEIGLNDHGVFEERVKGIQGKRPERRTKGGRKPPRERNLLRLEED